MIRVRETVKKFDDVILLSNFVRDGDEEAFARIVGKYETLVWNLCCRILHNRCDAEDAFQTTFLLLATKAHRIRNPKSLSSWLYGVAYRTASSIRKQRQRGMLPYENSVDTRLDEDVLEAVARKNENELVSAEIMLMKEKHKTPLLMFYFMGNSTSQIAEVLGTTISTVEGRLRRAKQTLRLKLRLRGVSVDEAFAALVVPVFAIQPSLKFATISNALAASISKSTACLLSKFTFGSKQIGAKIMLSKIAITLGIVCMTSVGLIHQSHSHQNGKLVQIPSDADDHFDSTIPIKFVQDDDEQDSPDIHQHLMEIHDHAYSVFRRFANRWMSGHNQKGRHNIIEITLEDAPDNSGNVFWVQEDDDIIVERAKLVEGVHLATLTVADSEAETASNEFRFKITESPQQLPSPSTDIPYLHKIPLIGKLFVNQNEDLKLEWLEAENENSDSDD